VIGDFDGRSKEEGPRYEGLQARQVVPQVRGRQQARKARGEGPEAEVRVRKVRVHRNDLRGFSFLFNFFFYFLFSIAAFYFQLSCFSHGRP
jgi:hypothetical protein